MNITQEMFYRALLAGIVAGLGAAIADNDAWDKEKKFSFKIFMRRFMKAFVAGFAAGIGFDYSSLI